MATTDTESREADGSTQGFLLPIALCIVLWAGHPGRSLRAWCWA